MLFIESSLSELYNSTVEAFPNTTRRQHATNTIVISRLNWTPFLGMKTLLIKGLAQNEGREYNPIIVFKNVRYHDQYDEPGLIKIIDQTERIYFTEQISYMESQVLVRCNCQDFQWRGNYYNHLDGSLYGRKRKKYEALHNPNSANPLEKPIVCKHLIKLTKVLEEAKLFYH
jgi:hypothetical protein